MIEEAITKENKMGTWPIPKLIILTSLPLIFSMFVNQLYNLVDSIFVSHIDEEALTGISLAAPIQMIMIALGCGLAVGLNAMISKSLGERKKEDVKNTASAAMIMIIGACLLIVLIGIIIVDPYFTWQAGDNDAIARYGSSYIKICMFFSLGQMTQWVFDRLLIATGKSTLFLATLGTASIVNLILDPILIFGYFGFPAMGTAGAGAATVIGQSAGGLLGIYLNIKHNKEIPICFQLHVPAKYFINIMKIGIPTAIMQGIMSVMGIFVNTILYQFSYTAVAIYGISLRVQSMSQIVVMGMNNGLIPIIAYNYGAKKEERIQKTIRCAFLYAAISMTVVFIFLELFPGRVLLLFDASEKMMTMGIPAIRFLSISYFVSTIGIMFAAIYQGYGNGVYSMYLAFMRQVILLIPFLLLGAWIGEINMVWLSFGIAETLAIPFGIFFYKKLKKGAK